MFVVAESQIKDKFARAFAKCRAGARKPKVHKLTADLYKVVGATGNVYAVKFRLSDGLLTCHCTCKAGQTNLVCYHAAAAYLVRRAFGVKEDE